MNSNIIRLSEQDLERLINESVQLILSERHVLKLPQKSIDDNIIPPIENGNLEPPMGGMDDSATVGEDIPIGDEDIDDSENEEIGEEENDTTFASSIGKLATQMKNGEIEAKDAKGPINQLLQAWRELGTADDIMDSKKILDGKGKDKAIDEPDEYEDEPQKEMPMENVKTFGMRINEILNGLTQNDIPTSDRDETEIGNRDIKYDSPFRYK